MSLESSRCTPSPAGYGETGPDQQYDRAYFPPSPKEGAWLAVCVGVLGSDHDSLIAQEECVPDTPRYRVLHSLGKGGMGEVFLADDSQLGRQVAIKFLSDGAADDGRALDRLYREARAAAGLDHPFICKIHEITEVDGRTGIVMEHVTGETLQAGLARAPLAPTRAVEIAGEIAEALEEAH